MKNSQQKLQPATVETKKHSYKDVPYEDDRYPGSFFKVPGVPRPGKTAWRSS
ncbi:hypothetical protein [Methylomarinum vadi]|uniref:hypothetical protein n=1 Tax=Methylomarinum vadi TaxID=438855 RepID=UPI001362522D|nr:hypothetical protein [Methylomarinum vadi]